MLSMDYISTDIKFPSYKLLNTFLNILVESFKKYWKTNMHNQKSVATIHQDFGFQLTYNKVYGLLWPSSSVQAFLLVLWFCIWRTLISNWKGKWLNEIQEKNWSLQSSIHFLTERNKEKIISLPIQTLYVLVCYGSILIVLYHQVVVFKWYFFLISVISFFYY